jgi:hypothetical protein
VLGGGRTYADARRVFARDEARASGSTLAGVSTSRETMPVTLELSPELVRRVDELRADRNLTRDELIGELIEGAKPRRIKQPNRASERQEPNPWAQVWPGGKA